MGYAPELTRSGGLSHVPRARDQGKVTVLREAFGDPWLDRLVTTAPRASNGAELAQNDRCGPSTNDQSAKIEAGSAR